MGLHPAIERKPIDNAAPRARRVGIVA